MISTALSCDLKPISSTFIPLMTRFSSQVDFTSCGGLLSVAAVLLMIIGIVTAIVLSFQYVRTPVKAFEFVLSTCVSQSEEQRLGGVYLCSHSKAFLLSLHRSPGCICSMPQLEPSFTLWWVWTLMDLSTMTRGKIVLTPWNTQLLIRPNSWQFNIYSLKSHRFVFTVAPKKLLRKWHGNVLIIWSCIICGISLFWSENCATGCECGPTDIVHFLGILKMICEFHASFPLFILGHAIAHGKRMLVGSPHWSQVSQQRTDG